MILGGGPSVAPVQKNTHGGHILDLRGPSVHGKVTDGWGKGDHHWDERSYMLQDLLC